MICSRFKWVSDRSFRIINLANQDCIFEMCEEEVSKKPYLKLLSVAKIDNLNENQMKTDSAHLLSDR